MSDLKVKSWSPSRLEKYEECPFRFKHQILLNSCPACFKGKLFGEWGQPQTCDTCGATEEVPAPITRGNVIGKSVENFVIGKAKALHKEIRHPKVIEKIKALRAGAKKGKVQAELAIVLDSNWRPVSQYTKGAWFRGRLDFHEEMDPKTSEVTDLKTGGIDKRSGAVKAEGKYDDQLLVYSTVTLVTRPAVQSVRASLMFSDCGPRFEPIIEREDANLKRSELPAVLKTWEKRIKPMFNDDVFAPRPSYKCGYCPFAKGKGGPCAY